MYKLTCPHLEYKLIDMKLVCTKTISLHVITIFIPLALSGAETFGLCYGKVVEARLLDNVGGLSFDTTATNTGVVKGDLTTI